MSDDIKTGGPAFPVPGLQHDEAFNGMTLRDWLAGQAMQALVTSRHGDDARGEYMESTVARNAYAMADAMLAERAK
jgi:hypothetical protein